MRYWALSRLLTLVSTWFFPSKTRVRHPEILNFAVERVQNKLQGWKGNLLSMAGRVVLSQAVISAIPSYVMQGCILPTQVLNNIDKVNRNFLMGTMDQSQKDAHG